MTVTQPGHALASGQEAAIAIFEEWGRIQADSAAYSLATLVDWLEGLRDITSSLAVIDGELSGLIYSRVWAEAGMHTTACGPGREVSVNRSKSVTTDGPLLVSAIASRLGDEFEGFRMVDPNGEMVPPGPAVAAVVERIADIAGLRNGSQSWAKTRLAPLGIDVTDYQTTKPGNPKVRVVQS